MRMVLWLSLARQWSAEDEEEQERERRRRHRQLNSTTEAKEETSSVVQNMTSRASNRFRSSSEVKPSRLGSSKPGNERALVEATNQQEDRGVRRRVEMLNNVKQDKKETLNARKLEKEAAERKAKPPSEPPQKQKEPIVEKCESLVHPKEPDEEKHQIVGEGKKEKTVEKHENLDQSEKDPKTHKDLVFSEEQQVPKAPQPQGVAAVQNEVATQQPQRASWERKSISRLEVKIQSRVRNFPEGAPATVGPQATERSSLKSEEAVSSLSGQDGSEAPLLVSHPVITYSSSFKRISPRTISFRVVPRKEKQEDTLSRSVSMRLPANTAKLEEKLERYTSAVQRAGSIKLPPSARRNFHPPSEGVASKRSIFEATVPIRAETTTPVRKESLKISGGVTSRINLWIRRTQEPSKDEGTKDIHKIENIAERTQLGKWPDDS
ncbi:ladinin-1 isoform X2 [Rhineura floridana]|uniref:ladinin-1 isoform X2 n=1 Tax=Rhineura floridana TaxID=261503 RepID=UPI002AC892B0|nr:ladinin-1 isoform X2 [Rhineura floridana]